MAAMAGRRGAARPAPAGAREFDPACTRCPRLARHLAQLRAEHPGYHAAPVASFGPADAGLLVVGLAPGRHGANRTGRPFTGDHAGLLLYRTLHDYGFANRPVSVSAGDGLQLLGCRVTNAVRCLPPANKPTPAEVAECNGYLAAELAGPGRAVILALGAVAHGAVLQALGLRPSSAPFGHGAEHALPGGRVLLDSYHCSRYNTQTGRLSAAMFARVVRRARALLDR